MNNVILLYGKPSTGKFTIAKHIKELIEKNGKTCFVFDNHFFNDIVFPYVDVSQHMNKICENVYKIRKIFLDTLTTCSNYKDTTIVFTNVLIDTEDDRKSVEQLIDFANKINAKFYSIQIVADNESILDWCINEDRKTKQKLTDKSAMKSFIENCKFMTLDNSITINNTNKSDTMKQIDDFIKDQLI